MKPLLLLDLDSTLFKTANFWQDFAVAFATASGNPEDLYVNHYADFTKGEGKAILIDYDTLLAHTHVAAESVRKAAKKQMAQKSYIFDDARMILDNLAQIRQKFDVAILTFGQESFQMLKIEHAPEIAEIPVYITQDIKTTYITENFGNRPWGVLVDDKPDQNLPKSWIEIHIDRRAAMQVSPEEVKPGVFRITRLDDVIMLINQI